MIYTWIINLSTISCNSTFLQNNNPNNNDKQYNKALEEYKLNHELINQYITDDIAASVNHLPIYSPMLVNLLLI